MAAVFTGYIHVPVPTLDAELAISRLGSTKCMTQFCTRTRFQFYSRPLFFCSWQTPPPVGGIHDDSRLSAVHFFFIIAESTCHFFFFARAAPPPAAGGGARFALRSFISARPACWISTPIVCTHSCRSASGQKKKKNTAAGLNFNASPVSRDALLICCANHQSEHSMCCRKQNHACLGCKPWLLDQFRSDANLCHKQSSGRLQWLS